MYQAIEVKFLPVTHTKPARLKAFCEAGSVTVGAHNYSAEQAAEALMAQLGWDEKYYGTLAGGQLKNGNYVFVMVKS